MKLSRVTAIYKTQTMYFNTQQIFCTLKVFKYYLNTQIRPEFLNTIKNVFEYFTIFKSLSMLIC